LAPAPGVVGDWTTDGGRDWARDGPADLPVPASSPEPAWFFLRVK
jgi:hypothetical protein